MGEVAQQSGIFLGGTQQIYIPAPWKIKGIKIEKFDIHVNPTDAWNTRASLSNS